MDGGKFLNARLSLTPTLPPSSPQIFSQAALFSSVGGPKYIIFGVSEKRRFSEIGVIGAGETHHLLAREIPFQKREGEQTVKRNATQNGRMFPRDGLEE